jgi:transglutaminase-like putative cysteine protease
MPILTVRHLTRYRYQRPVAFGEHRLMFRPREGHDQRIISERLVITPEPVSLRFVHDVFGNSVGFARFGKPADELTFESIVELDHRPTPLDDKDDLSDPAARYPVVYSVDDVPDLLRSIERKHDDPEGELARWAQRFVRRRGRTGLLALLSEMTHAIHDEFRYAGRLDGGTQTPLQTLSRGTGTCRDFATLMIEAARQLDLAARFVSGYICARPGGAGQRLGGGHTHAWARVYLPRHGWVDFDPTNGIVGSTDLIRVAVARDSVQAAPLTGSWDGELEDYIGMDVEVDVRAKRAATVIRRVA